MKKILALMLVFAVILAFAACGGSGTNENTDTTAPSENETENTGGEIAGGYTVKEDITAVELPEEVKGAFDAALKDYTGLALTPVAYLGSQVVAGANYAVLCLGKAVTPDAKAALKVAVINKDVEGKSSVLRVNDFDLAEYAGAQEEKANDAADTIEVASVENDDAVLLAAAPEDKAAVAVGAEAPVAQAPKTDAAAPDKNEEAPADNALSGGWTLNTKYPEAVLTEEEKAACAVFEGIMGTQYQPVACLATQVVAGINYAMLVKATMSAADDAVELRVVTVYSGVDGSLDVLGTKTLDLAKIAG